MKGLSCSAWHQVPIDALIFTQLTVPQFSASFSPTPFLQGSKACAPRIPLALTWVSSANSLIKEQLQRQTSRHLGPHKGPLGN